MAGRVETCANCRWWDPESVERGELGLCRAAPPQLSGGIPEWPVTGDEDWCGAFVPNARVEKIADAMSEHRTLADPPLDAPRLETREGGP